jgi:putative transposase
MQAMSNVRSPLYRRHRFPPEIISYSVWLYFRFPLSLRMVEEMLAARGICMSYETVRQWAGKFGRKSSDQIRGGPCARRQMAFGRGRHFDRGRNLLAYDADSLRNWLKQGQIKALAPSTAHSLSSRRQGLQAQKRHRTHVLQAEQLATHRNAIRPRRAKLSLRPRPRSHNRRMDLNE